MLVRVVWCARFIFISSFIRNVISCYINGLHSIHMCSATSSVLGWFLSIFPNLFFNKNFLFCSTEIQSKEKMMKGVRRGCVRLKGAVIGIDDQDVNTFTITVDHKTFHFQVSRTSLYINP